MPGRLSTVFQYFRRYIVSGQLETGVETRPKPLQRYGREVQECHGMELSCVGRLRGVR